MRKVDPERFMPAEGKELTINMVVDPGQLLSVVVTPLPELHKFSIRRLKLSVGLFQQFLVLANLELQTLLLFGEILASFIHLGFVERLEFLHFCLKFGNFIIFGPEESEVIILLLQFGLMLSFLFEKMQHHIRHGHTIFKRC